MPRDPGDLPTELTSFVGRRHELAEIRRSLGATRLLTLTGVGGVGKTRLALRAAATLARAFPGGVRLVELADLDTPEQLADQVAVALGAEVDAFVAERQLLVVLDNCEHLLDACAALVERLLAASGKVHVLTTSRQPLGMVGERTLTVEPLTVPARSTLRPTMLDQYDSVRLFVDRATAILPGFRVTDDNCAQVIRLCARLDGIPLAIELAAARLRAYALPQLVELIDDRFALLTTGNRSGHPRQRTLRALIDWSFDLCTPPEQALWSRLSVFADGFEQAAAVEVCSGDGLDADAVAETLTMLLDKSIVLRTERDGQPRYRMLETIRQYGGDRLAAAGRQEVLGRRHRDWCKRLIAEADHGWSGPDQVHWYERMRRERANLQAALNFCLLEDGDGHAAVELATSLCVHRKACTSLSEGRRWLDHVLRRVQQPSTARAKALWVNAWLALMQGDSPAARALLEQCERLARAVGDHRALAYTTQFSGLADLFEGEPDKAIARLEDAIAQHRSLDASQHARLATMQLVMARCFAGDPSSKLALRTARDTLGGPPDSMTSAYLSWYEAVALARDGRGRAAADPAMHALRVAGRAGDRWLQSLSLETLGWSVGAAGNPARAARLLGAAAMTRREVGSKLAGLGHLLPWHEAAATAARDRLGDEQFEAEYRAGAAMTEEQAVALGVGDRQAVRAPEPTVAAESPLTRREREVAGLVAEGLSNREIATRLLIAHRTAGTHVGHILTKLGFTSRAQIAAWAAEQSARPGF